MPESDAERLIKILEAELAAKRVKSVGAERNNRTGFRIWSIVVIIGAVVAAMVMLQWMVSELPRPVEPPAQEEPSQP